MDEQQYEKFKKFVSDLAQEVELILRDNYNLVAYSEVAPILKTNGEQLGMHVKFEGSNVAPTVYPEYAFQEFQSGKPLNEIAEQMSEQVYEAYKRTPEIPEFTLDEAKRCITLTLVNTERNEQLLSNTPHFEIGDLSAIPRWYLSEEASFVVSNDMATKLNLTPEEVLQIGQEHINAQQFKIMDMRDIMHEMFMKEGMDPELAELMLDDTDTPRMIVMTSYNNIQGSNSLLSEAALNQVHDSIGDFVVLPSSLHEVICVPIDEKFNPEDFRTMVREVNMTQVSSQDFLSNNIMKYDGQKLKLVTDGLKMDAPKLEVPKMETPKMKRAMHYSSIKM